MRYDTRTMVRSAPLLVLCALAGCSEENPAVLWLAPDQVETRVALVDTEPRPY